MNNKTKKRLIIAIAILICISALTIIKCQKEASKEYLETVLIGSDIIDALNKYYKSNECYPETLTQLVPSYLDKLLDPTWGEKEWLYEISNTDKNYFWLAVRRDSTNTPPLYYMRFPDGSGTWYYDDDASSDSWVYE